MQRYFVWTGQQWRYARGRNGCQLLLFPDVDFQSLYVQDDGELRLQRILLALKGIADMLPAHGAELAHQSLSPQRQEEQAAAAGFQRAVLRMFGAADKASLSPDVFHRQSRGNILAAAVQADDKLSCEPLTCLMARGASRVREAFVGHLLECVVAFPGQGRCC